MNPLLIVLIIVLIICFIFVIWYISTLNKSVIKIDEAFSGIDVALVKRYDVLTKMIDVVKGYENMKKILYLK